jgi:hypothetical protein
VEFDSCAQVVQEAKRVIVNNKYIYIKQTHTYIIERRERVVLCCVMFCFVVCVMYRFLPCEVTPKETKRNRNAEPKSDDRH